MNQSDPVPNIFAPAAATRRLGAVPLACYLLLVAYAGHAALVTGHWPTYNNPDPKQLPLRPLLHALEWIVLVGAFAIFALPLVYGIARGIAVRRQRPFSLQPGTVPLYLLGVVLWVMDFVLIRVRGPWSGLLDWFLD